MVKRRIGKKERFRQKYFFVWIHYCRRQKWYRHRKSARKSGLKTKPKTFSKDDLKHHIKFYSILLIEFLFKNGSLCVVRCYKATWKTNLVKSHFIFNWQLIIFQRFFKKFLTFLSSLLQSGILASLQIVAAFRRDLGAQTNIFQVQMHT